MTSFLSQFAHVPEFHIDEENLTLSFKTDYWVPDWIPTPIDLAFAEAYAMEHGYVLVPESYTARTESNDLYTEDTSYISFKLVKILSYHYAK